MRGKLILADGTTFVGESFGTSSNCSGEVVFNTGMVGYPESLTDPSYFGQILVLTYPLIGNYGIPESTFWESKNIQIKGLIVQNYINNPSHFESKQTLKEWLLSEKIPALFGVDTRALTRKLRHFGVMLGKIALDESQEENNTRLKTLATCDFFDPNLENVLPKVSVNSLKTYGEGKKHVILIDCGAKENILRSFIKRKIRVTVVPWNFNPLNNPQVDSFDGVMISNGPGDPKQARESIDNIRQLLESDIPTFGICLGSQILSLAAMGDTYKLKFGHRGQNQPVIDKLTKKAIITSQNHGFAVDVKSLGSEWIEWFVNLNDGSNEGIRHKKKPFLAVQFHPESSPGPIDGSYLFDEFVSFL